MDRSTDVAPQRFGEDLEPGLNVIGYLRAVNGLGEATRLMLPAIEMTGIPFQTMDYKASPSREGSDFEEHAEVGVPRHDVNLLCVNADMVPTFARDAGPGVFMKRYTIGTWAWETEEFPPVLLGSLDFVDEVWMPSDYSSDAIRKVTTKPVFTFGHPIVRPPVAQGISRAGLGLPDSYMFLFCFDFYSVAKRKNPTGLIEAFKRAFQPGDGPVLVIKTLNADKRPEDSAALHAAAEGRDDIIFFDRYMTAEEKNSLIGLCDCYVSLHRSEGFGLTLAEAMALGRPVIATGYSGNLDFMNDDNSYLVKWRPALVGEDVWNYPASGRWAEPDIEDAARLMRHAQEHPEEAAARGRRAQEDILRSHAPARQADFIRERYDTIRGSGLLAAAAQNGDRWAFAGAMQRASLMLSRGPEVELPTERGGPYSVAARSFRRVLKRVLRNQWVYQRDVGTALLEALREVDAKRQREAAGTSRALADIDARLRELSARLEAVEAALERSPEHAPR
ncbi:MAG: hypothetical protein QOE92_2354 [Chloroflexota bacterium]|nr:hypothetical protein [Chloroflexota bacterium]